MMDMFHVHTVQHDSHLRLPSTWTVPRVTKKLNFYWNVEKQPREAGGHPAGQLGSRSRTLATTPPPRRPVMMVSSRPTVGSSGAEFWARHSFLR